jgi:hypothetical protein
VDEVEDSLQGLEREPFLAQEACQRLAQNMVRFLGCRAGCIRVGVRLGMRWNGEYSKKISTLVLVVAQMGMAETLIAPDQRAALEQACEAAMQGRSRAAALEVMEYVAEGKPDDVILAAGGEPVYRLSRHESLSAPEETMSANTLLRNSGGPGCRRQSTICRR